MREWLRWLLATSAHSPVVNHSRNTIAIFYLFFFLFFSLHKLIKKSFNFCLLILALEGKWIVLLFSFSLLQERMWQSCCLSRCSKGKQGCPVWFYFETHLWQTSHISLPLWPRSARCRVTKVRLRTVLPRSGKSSKNEFKALKANKQKVWRFIKRK